MDLVSYLLVGAIAGSVAGILVKGSGLGVVRNMAVGVVGAMIGGYLLQELGFHLSSDWLTDIAAATFGSVVLFAVLGVLRVR